VLVEDECIRIVVDIPGHLFPFRGISHPVSILNIDQLNRLLPSNVKVDYLKR